MCVSLISGCRVTELVCTIRLKSYMYACTINNDGTYVTSTWWDSDRSAEFYIWKSG